MMKSRQHRLQPAGDRIRVGLPRALLSFRYQVLWRSFLQELGCEVVETPATNRTILFAGVKATVDDICIPVKAYVGHFLHLRELGVDAVLVPYMLSVEKSVKARYTCPKFMGLPDMLRALLGEPPLILDAEHDVQTRPLTKTFEEIGRALGFSRRQSKGAFELATLRQSRFKAVLTETGDFTRATAAAASDKITPLPTAPASGGGGKIALVGHSYLLFDDFLSFSLTRRLHDLGAELVNQYSVPQDIIEMEMAHYDELSWSYERELLGAVSHFMGREDVQGIVFLTSFACGTFAVVSEIIEREVRPRHSKPILYLMVDELTGEGGVQTRLESFCDMISGSLAI